MKGKVPSLLLLLLGGALPFTWLMLRQENQDEAVQEVRRLTRLVRSLNASQIARENITSEQERKTENVIKIKFPWLLKKKWLPNFYHKISPGLRKYRPYTDDYLTGSVVFYDNSHAAQPPMMECVRNIGISHHLSMSPDMSSAERFAWEFTADKARNFRNKIKLHRGKYSFGLCESLNVSCSYFSFFRDPFEQAVTNYQQCKNELEDELCQGVNANKVTLRDWIILHGSPTFQQLTFDPVVCNSSANITLPNDDAWLGSRLNPPCWMKQKLFMDKFGEVDILHAVRYVETHLQDWFSVVGLHNEMEDSLKMMETVYKLPFTKCSRDVGVDYLSEKSSRLLLNSAKSKIQRRSEFFDDSDPYYVLEDGHVQKALAADYHLYKQAVRLFKIQKQLQMNGLHSS